LLDGARGDPSPRPGAGWRIAMTKEQVRGAVILLALALLWTAWRLWRHG
jgi:hypothetical protein